MMAITTSSSIKVKPAGLNFLSVVLMLGLRISSRFPEA
jgi:hypothetical protein